MASVLTVSQLNSYISSKIRFDSKLKGIAVKGEIANLSVNYKSGHMYFTLKDEASAVKCVMFSSAASRLRFKIQNGMSVMAMGNIDVYERDGVYQIIASDILPSGAGVEAVALEQLKKKLSDAGVFDEASKKKIPKMPKHIAVVTSPDAAALQDILNILQRRYPICKVTIVPTLVQGITAPHTIEKAICKADELSCDTIILARGGGSAEDLSAFNAENVVMAVFNSKTPIVSAIGHQTDTTLCDYAADMRAPTPSAAAELCVPDIAALIDSIDNLEDKLYMNLYSRISEYIRRLDNLFSKLNNLSPKSKLSKQASDLDKLQIRLQNAMSSKLKSCENNTDILIAKLAALSPLNVLQRGYSVTINENSKVVSSINEVKTDDIVKIMLSDGEITAKVL